MFLNSNKYLSLCINFGPQHPAAHGVLKLLIYIISIFFFIYLLFFKFYILICIFNVVILIYCLVFFLIFSNSFFFIINSFFLIIVISIFLLIFFLIIIYLFLNLNAIVDPELIFSSLSEYKIPDSSFFSGKLLGDTIIISGDMQGGYIKTPSGHIFSLAGSSVDNVVITNADIKLGKFMGSILINSEEILYNVVSEINEDTFYFNIPLNSIIKDGTFYGYFEYGEFVSGRINFPLGSIESGMNFENEEGVYTFFQLKGCDFKMDKVVTGHSKIILDLDVMNSHEDLKIF